MALTTRADVKAFRDITVSDFDGRIDLLLPMVDEIINGFTRRTLCETTITNERQHGRGSPFLFPYHAPIQSITSMNLIDPTSGAVARAFSTDEFELAGVDQKTGVGEYVVLTGQQTRRVAINFPYTGPIFPVGMSNVDLTYVAGYPTGSIPKDLQLAAIRTVWFQVDNPSSGYRSERINKYSYTRNLGSSGSPMEQHPDIPAEAVGTLMRYRRIRMERATLPVGEVLDDRFQTFP